MIRPHGRARVNPESPEAFGRCDRCSFLFNLRDLQYQFDWAGTQLVNRHLRVCRTCLDKPFIFNRAIILEADPIPVFDPRPENYAEDDAGGIPGPSGGDGQFELDESEMDEGTGGPHL